MVDERTAEFGSLFTRVLNGLRRLAGTSGDALIFTCSTTGAFESAIQNLFSPGDEVLVVNSGAFGARWVELCKAFGLGVTELVVPWGEEPDPDEVAAQLRRNRRIEAAIIVHCETSTGAVCDLRAFGLATQSVLSIVDSASGFGACDLQVDGWSLDVVISGTQKALMTPPGLSFVTVSERAWRRHEQARLPKYYFDWSIARENIMKVIPRTPWTPAISTLVQLDASLSQIFTEGIETCLDRHILLGRLTRAGFGGLGLPLLTPANDRNSVVTAAYVPSGIDAQELVDTVAAQTGVQLAAGNGELENRIIRLGHCGWMDPLDVVSGIAALEVTLRGFGLPVEPGAGVVPLLRVLSDHYHQTYSCADVSNSR